MNINNLWNIHDWTNDFFWISDIKIVTNIGYKPSREKERYFFSFKPIAGGFYSSDIGLLDSLYFFLFDLFYFLSLVLFDCQFILNQTKKFIVLLYVSSNRFGKTKTLVQLNRLEKVIDRSTADGRDGSYRLQSLMVLHWWWWSSCCKLWLLRKAARNSMEW